MIKFYDENSTEHITELKKIMEVKMKVHRTKLAQLFSDLDGRIACVDFIKIDGSERTMVFRLHVNKYIKGSDKLSVARYGTPYLTAFDMTKRAYRNINLDTVRKVRANGLTYHVV